MDAQTVEVVEKSLKSITWEKGLWALAIAIICYIAIRLIMRFSNHALDRLPLDKTLSGFVRAAMRVVLYFVAGIIVAGALGVPVTSLIALLSVIGLAVSLAVQGALSNVAGGLTLLVSKPFAVGDFVELGGVSGTVTGIGLSYTRMTDAENKAIFIPNSEISSSRLINYSAMPVRRMEIKISVSYDAPVERVKQALMDAFHSVDGLVSDPAPFAGITGFGDSGVNYALRAWGEREKYWDAYFLLLERVKSYIDQAGVEFAYNRMDVALVKDEAGK